MVKTKMEKDSWVKWKEEFMNHLRKLKDVLTEIGLTKEEATDFYKEVKREISDIISDLEAELGTYLEETSEEF